MCIASFEGYSLQAIVDYMYKNCACAGNYTNPQCAGNYTNLQCAGNYTNLQCAGNYTNLQCAGNYTNLQCSRSKLCRMELPTMDEVADVLKKMYDQSSYAMTIPSSSPQQVLVVEGENFPEVHTEKMIYFDQSPDYCTADPYYNIAGTAGRECTLNDTSSSGHCDNLCCDHGYETFTQRTGVKKLCNCKFVRCCYIECGTCYETETKHRCRKHQASMVHQGMYFDKTFFLIFCNLIET